MEAWSPGVPSAHLGMLVGLVVVHDELKVEFRWRFLVNDPQEGEKLLMAMALGALADHLGGGHIEGGEQGERRGGSAERRKGRHVLRAPDRIRGIRIRPAKPRAFANRVPMRATVNRKFRSEEFADIVG